MIKNVSILEVLKGERVYQLHLPSNAPLGELHDVLFQMRSFVVDKINEAVQIDAPKPLEEPKQEETQAE